MVHNLQTVDLIRAHLLLIGFFCILLIFSADQFQSSDLLHRLFDLTAHASILHDTFLQILNMDILLHTDIFLYEIFQFDIHTERDRTFE